MCQEKELRKHSPIPPIPSPVHAVPALVQPMGDINSVGLPSISDLAAARFRYVYHTNICSNSCHLLLLKMSADVFSSLSEEVKPNSLPL